MERKKVKKEIKFTNWGKRLRDIIKKNGKSFPFTTPHFEYVRPLSAVPVPLHRKITQAKIYLNSIKKNDHTCVVFIIWPASFCNAAP